MLGLPDDAHFRQSRLPVPEAVDVRVNETTSMETSERKRYVIGVDIGGTFTDLVLHDSLTGALSAVKSFTTPGDPSAGFLDAVDRAGVSLSEVETFLTHGSTTAINTILTRSGVKVGFITTRGHRDMLDIGRAFREEGHLYDPSWQRPHVARPCATLPASTVRERIVADGSVLWPLDEDELRSTLDRSPRRGRRGHSRVLPELLQEPGSRARAREIIQEAWPEVRCRAVVRGRPGAARVRPRDHPGAQLVRLPSRRVLPGRRSQRDRESGDTAEPSM